MQKEKQESLFKKRKNMEKKKTFSFTVGTCEYEFKNGLYSFTAKVGGDVMFFALPSDVVVKSMLTTDGDLEDTARGLVDILFVSMWDKQVGNKLQTFSGPDAFIPLFLGHYHYSMLKNSPWPVESMEKIFSRRGYEYFKALTAMFIDNGQIVMCSIPHALSAFSKLPKANTN